jgi:cytochrome c-type biogenesis protein
VTFGIAFLAGVLGILSPCILPMLPAYFSYTFKEKKNITFMTFVFFIGFSITFLIMGMVAGFLGQQTFNMIQGPLLIRIAAVFIFILGAMAFFGKSFTLIKINYQTNNDVLGVFVFGILFAISWTGCLGPVLSGILGMGAIIGDITKSGIMMFFYGLGNFVPLFILSVFYDKFNLQKFLKGRTVEVFNWELNSVNIVSGVLLMLSSIFLLIFGDTTLFNGIDPLRTKQMFFDYQNRLLEWSGANVLAIAALILFAVLIIYTILNFNKKEKSE